MSSPPTSSVSEKIASHETNNDNVDLLISNPLGNKNIFTGYGHPKIAVVLFPVVVKVCIRNHAFENCKTKDFLHDC